jgi:hypothetical protein
MNCYYWDRISAVDTGYGSAPPHYDLGTAAPKCIKHWLYVCGKCGEAHHFIRMDHCDTPRKFFCSNCANATDEVMDRFWAWEYYFSYSSPWSDKSTPALDPVEFHGTHPLQVADTQAEAEADISQEQYVVRYPETPTLPSPQCQFADADVEASWNINADCWDATNDNDGHRNRPYLE